MFSDRARRTRPEFRVTPENSDTVTEICRRLDGLPLAIELAAARVRALSPTEILNSLHDQFRLLTGGARTAVRRQQTLRASVDWSHALLSEPEQVLFRRLAVFLGGFDLDAAQAVAGGADVERYQVLDQLTLLVDKSLVVAEDSRHGTRYRLLETVRQYAQEKLDESREGDAIRGRHRDHYTAMAAQLDAAAGDGYERRIEQAEAEIDNLRAAFAWSRERSQPHLGLTLAAALLPLWVTRRRMQEGLDWLDAALADAARRAPRNRWLACGRRWLTVLLQFTGVAVDLDAERILAAAREFGDPALVARALMACGCFANDDRDKRGAYFAEAAGLARDIGDSWWLGQILFFEATFAVLFGEPVAAEAAAEEGHRIADNIGAGSLSGQFRYVLAWTRILRGDLTDGLAQLREIDEDLTAARDGLFWVYVSNMSGDGAGLSRTYGSGSKDRRSGPRTFVGLISRQPWGCPLCLRLCAFGSRRRRAAWEAFEAGRELTGMYYQAAGMYTWAGLAPLACGDLAAARRWADDVVSATTAWCLAAALTSRARVEIAQGELDAAERDACQALDIAV